LSQFVLFAVFAAAGLGQLSEVWGELSQAAGSAERLTELLAIEPTVKTPAVPVRLPMPPRGEVAFDNVRFVYPTRTQAPAIDGVRLAEADPHDVRAHIAVVPQDVAVFATTVRDNIRFGRPDASDAEIARAAELAAAAEFIERLPEKFDTPIGERGITLSGGQR